MRFGQNVLRIIWKERFVQFSWKAHCFPFLERIWGQCDNFHHFDAHECDLAKTCSAWPEKRVLYNFHEKHTVSLFGENLRPVWQFSPLWRSQVRFGQNVLRMIWKERLVQFSWKVYCFPVLRTISGQFDDFDKFDTLKCDLAKTCSAWPEKRVLYNFHEKRTVFPFWRELGPVWRSQMRFCQNELGMTWKERFVQFLWKAHCFPVLKRISGQCDDFENFDAEKCDLGKTCCAWSEKSVLYNFHEKRTVFPFWREFEASVTIFTTLTLTSAIWPKRAAHDLKRRLCTIFMKSALFSLFGENWGQCDAHKCDFAKTCWACPKKNVLYNFHRKRTVFPFWREFRPVWRLWQLWRSKMRFAQNVLRMTWKKRFV